VQLEHIYEEEISRRGATGAVQDTSRRIIMAPDFNARTQNAVTNMIDDMCEPIDEQYSGLELIQTMISYDHSHILIEKVLDKLDTKDFADLYERDITQNPRVPRYYCRRIVQRLRRQNAFFLEALMLIRGELEFPSFMRVCYISKFAENLRQGLIPEETVNLHAVERPWRFEMITHTDFLVCNAFLKRFPVPSFQSTQFWRGSQTLNFYRLRYNGGKYSFDLQKMSEDFIQAPNCNQFISLATH